MEQVNGVTTKEKIGLVTGGNVTTPKGFSAGGLHCGIRKQKLDLGWLYSDVPAHAAGVYTTNAFQAAPLKVTQESIAVEQKLQAILVNSGIANACTGEQGLKDAYEMRRSFSEKIQIPEHLAAVASTGLIGELLPMEKIQTGISQIHEQENNDTSRFETAILTTDTREKGIAVQFEIDGKQISIGGAAKGSGMIHPNMATMLSFVTTDANIDDQALSRALKSITNTSFNMITVDGDTSTNDMVLVMANGKAENAKLTEEHPEWNVFVEALSTVCELLAKEIARDGEGASKLVEVQVNGANSDRAAQIISKSVISSNLVKTAIHGADANWGRIITAIGYSGEQLDPDKVNVSLGPIKVVENGIPYPFDEEKAKAYLLQDTVVIQANLGDGSGKATAWGCDLSYEYVRINASYRT
ncbi:bifunctional ornithine acetyltransferase/N-acetylglutamate synthase [Aquibacillus koreensis]|uniref:Arginine biosynthesis bifunctional protein ArgJ n=1 Tax=Aquibacillus koreensis TaxID=279446 RepID=A0A9X4AK12_9BACI|nr:bifunctional ornithine acetyltransferase/N-acetylglutamate synthase [Aquibacillus koreensis]MCT2538133.1 bifunctional ornithine acetyltransferase/N-acetylglutamate synthase [Aquibacillus koreensis]MDC3420923.1 bifunctional ornithine acetyltransferase/N-acetylglutamate synthase [Aquibacillus koreensis]